MSVADVVKGAGRCGVYAGSTLLIPLVYLSAYPIEVILALSASQRTSAAFHAGVTELLSRSNNSMLELLRYSCELILFSETPYLVGRMASILLGAPPTVITLTLGLVWLSGALMIAIGVALYALGVGLENVPPIHYRMPASCRFFSPEPAITRLSDPEFGEPSLAI